MGKKWERNRCPSKIDVILVSESSDDYIHHLLHAGLGYRSLVRPPSPTAKITPVPHLGRDIGRSLAPHGRISTRPQLVDVPSACLLFCIAWKLDLQE